MNKEDVFQITLDYYGFELYLKRKEDYAYTGETTQYPIYQSWYITSFNIDETQWKFDVTRRIYKLVKQYKPTSIVVQSRDDKDNGIRMSSMICDIKTDIKLAYPECFI
jgi:hypothetical protein